MARVYVGTYGKYNAGSIAGAWLDCEDYADHEEFMKACRKLHKREHDPEFMFQDYEGFPEGFYGESSISPELWEWLKLDDDDQKLLAAYQSAVDQNGTIEKAREAYRGEAETEKDYAEQYVDETGLLDSMPEELQAYFDFEAYAATLFADGLRLHEGYVFDINC